MPICISTAGELASVVRDGFYAVSCDLLPHECNPVASAKRGCRCGDGWAAARVESGVIVDVVGRDSCEPEDALLVRDFAWVVERLEADRAKLAAAEARAVKAEGEHDALAAERVMFCALVESLTKERDEARRQLGEVTRERDALKAGKWAGAWEAMPPTLRWARFGVAGVKAEVGPGDSGWWHWTDSGSQDRDESLDAAKAAADAHLVAAGWWLEGGAFVAGEAK